MLARIQRKGNPPTVLFLVIVFCVLRCVQLSATPQTVAHQALLSMGFPRQEYGIGFPFPSPGGLPDRRIETASLEPPASSGRFFTSEPPHCWQEFKLVQPLWEIVWRVLKKLKIEVPYPPAIPVLCILSEKDENSNSKRYMHSNVHSRTICNSQDMETTQVTLDRRLD